MVRLLLIRHGETTWNSERRLQGWSEAPLSERGREQVAVVSHGGTLGLLIEHLLDQADPARPSPYHFANTGVSLIAIEGRRRRLILLNDTRHLDNDPLHRDGAGPERPVSRASEGGADHGS